jgi:hypothetical protein
MPGPLWSVGNTLMIAALLIFLGTCLVLTIGRLPGE